MFMTDTIIAAKYPKIFWLGYSDAQAGVDNRTDVQLVTFEKKAYLLGRNAYHDQPPT